MSNQYTVFYSWQSDDHDTRCYIRKCLKKAIKRVKKDIIIDTRPELDEATKGVKGAVDIPSTVMRKISNCNLFVADLSFVGTCNGRKLVNQNVLFELGYAMRRSGGKDVIMLFNNDKGKVGDLPFDISHRRVSQFSMKEDESGEQLTQELARIIADDMQGEKDTTLKFGGVELDDEEIELLKLFKSMDNDEKHIMIINTLDGGFVHVASRGYDKELLARIEKQGGRQRLVANLDSLVDKNILKKYYGGDGMTPNYMMKKTGYKIIEML